MSCSLTNLTDELHDSGCNDLPKQSNADVLGRALAGDQSAWDDIVNRFGGLVLHTARRVGLNASDAADVAQLTWLRLFEHGHQIRRPEHLPAWLVSTARREAIRVAIASKRYVLCDDPAAEYGRTDQHSAVDAYPTDGGYEPDTDRALHRLPTYYETLLRLLTSDLELSYAEIASQMHIPVGSIGPMRMRALRLLEKSPELRRVYRARTGHRV